MTAPIEKTKGMFNMIVRENHNSKKMSGKSDIFLEKQCNFKYHYECSGITFGRIFALIAHFYGQKCILNNSVRV
jgi:hypothetical protein